mmetsp:Transcript_1037/g.1505  ORF Transcript_1037/g.1505 Transcript_1037/m.1505 type:complete len:537 (-) Transcript_1037:27-1637(-)
MAETEPVSKTEEATPELIEESPKKPHPVQIVSIGTAEDAYAFTFHEDKMLSILSRIPPGWKVAVVTVAGAFRTGKSFLLSWFLKHLNHLQNLEKKGETGSTSKWYDEYSFLDVNDTFSWRGGAERNTTGIWMWSHPHFIDNMGVLLVDTQGMFDHETTMGLTASIFGLSTLLSSYQIYNVDKRIQEDNLQQLALFSEYARTALGKDQSENPSKPFQTIEFLVRDWQNFDEEDDMEEMEREMTEYLESVIAEREAKDLKDTREQINSCFAKVSCYLLSHPGFAVTKKKFAGDVKLMDEMFVKLMDKYCDRVFGKIQPKVIHGRVLTSAELCAYIKEYANLFASGANFPEAATMLEATVSANNTNAVQLALKAYMGEMDRVAGPHCSSYINPEDLEDAHKENLGASMRLFENMANFGNPNVISKSKRNLMAELDEKREVYEKLNDGRNPLSGLATFFIPMGIGVIALVMRMLADNTCSSWSDVCRTGSEVLSEVYSIVFFFMLIVASTKFKQISDLATKLYAAFQALNSGPRKSKKND